MILEVRSPAPAERVAALVAHAERGCHSSQSLRAAVPVCLLARLNGNELEPGTPPAAPDGASMA